MDLNAENPIWLRYRLQFLGLDEYAIEQATESFHNNDGQGFADAGYRTGTGLRLVSVFADALIARSIFEVSLLSAYTGCKRNNRLFPVADIEALFQKSDPVKLRNAGGKLPGTGPFTIYRGVSGKSAARRVRGLSWTSDLDRACWFAVSCGDSRLNPAVYTATVSADQVYAHVINRDEQEFVVRPDKCKRLPMTLEEMNAASERLLKARHEKWLRSLAESKAKRAA